MKKQNFLITYDPKKEEEMEDIVVLYEHLKEELESWNIRFEERNKKDKEKNQIMTIENDKFSITVATADDMIRTMEADHIYANKSQKEVLGKKAKYFTRGTQYLVDIVEEIKGI